MANVLAGFRPVKHLNGSPYNGQLNRYMVSASETVAINVGDLVVLSDSAALVDAADTVGVYPAVERAGTSTTTPVTTAAIVGAVVGFEPDYSNLNLGPVRLASTRRVVFVADSPDIIFAAPQDAAGGVVAAASVGLNANLIPGVTSTTGNFASGMSVDSSSVTTTNTAPLRIVGVTAAPDQDVTSTARPAELLVAINTHQYNANTGSTGV
jgi:hypothetical protein